MTFLMGQEGAKWENQSLTKSQLANAPVPCQLVELLLQQLNTIKAGLSMPEDKFDYEADARLLAERAAFLYAPY